MTVIIMSFRLRNWITGMNGVKLIRMMSDHGKRLNMPSV